MDVWYMSKIGTWLLEMTEYAAESTREEFIKKYGEAHVDIWDSENKGDIE